MKKQVKILVSVLIFMLAVLICVYFGLAVYYKDGFAVNTWINGVYCTGKTVDEVNEELQAVSSVPVITITDPEGKTYEIDMGDLEYSCDYRIALSNFLRDQNPYLWVNNITFHRNYSIKPQISYDENRLRAIWNELDFVAEERSRENGVKIVRNENQYTLENGLIDRVDCDRAYEGLRDAIVENEFQYVVPQTCTYDSEPNADQKKLLELWEKIDDFQASGIVYDMGAEKVKLSAFSAWFLKAENGIPVVDESGTLVIDQAGIEQFVSDLAQKYDTYGKEREFFSTCGQSVTIPAGTYGTVLNQGAEIKWLSENLSPDAGDTKEQLLHIPAYSREAYARGENDIGGTYIEVDLSDQKLYCYVDYELSLETDIVTGCIARRNGTPEGTFYVYNKQRSRVLRGPNYATYVKYWMPVKNGVGIHDADWRSEFGGEIYKKSGSHGCINVPKEIMPEIYDLYEVGTPVLIFYHDSEKN